MIYLYFYKLFKDKCLKSLRLALRNGSLHHSEGFFCICFLQPLHDYLSSHPIYLIIELILPFLFQLVNAIRLLFDEVIKGFKGHVHGETSQ